MFQDEHVTGEGRAPRHWRASVTLLDAGAEEGDDAIRHATEQRLTKFYCESTFNHQIVLRRITVANMKLVIEFDAKDALRLARYEVETGNDLRDVLIGAVELWEGKVTMQPSVLANSRIPVEFPYKPQGSAKRHFTDGLYDRRSNEIEITKCDARQLVGVTGSPSGTAGNVVEAFNPIIISPNRNGTNDWREKSTKRPIRTL